MIQLKNINHYYINKKHQDRIVIFDDFNLKIKKNEFVSLVGPSGCGKTTLVNIIAGYTKPISGEIIINKKNVDVPGKDRIVINQENDLFEWMTVYENMQLITKDKKNIIKYLKLTHLYDFKDFYPSKLSGGMKKCLSLARILAVDSQFIIMDEPFGSLDHQIKGKLHEKLLDIVKLSKKTILLVTHDIEEAIFLSDRVILLDSHPASIKKEISILFSHPRMLNIKDSSKFRRLKSKINNIFLS